ncbi:MAG: LamG domain-containing protein, partial [Planctomycetes bacterium]|nr:LamG domain-containing protein [Planctomycetota bacterium]
MSLDAGGTDDNRGSQTRKRTVSKGFSLYVDSKRALHFTTTNCGYGRTVRTSSDSGAVPVGKWVHVAGVSAVFPVKHRRIYVNGEELRSIPITWGKGIVVHREEEKKPTPLYIGNSKKGDAGLIGLIDEVRVHRNIFRFWPREDMKWAEANDKREIPDGPPYFVEVHRPQLHLSLDGDTDIRSAASEEAKASVSLRNKAGKELVGEVAKVIPAEQSLEIPELEEGIYHVVVLVTLRGEETEESDVFTFVRKSFPWEDNELGSKKPFAPAWLRT